MAGQAAKKTAKNAEVKSFYYFCVFAGASVLNGVLRLGLLGDGSIWSLVEIGFLAAVSWMSYKMIKSSLDLGVGYSLWQDLFIINTFVQMFSILSSYFWIFYLTVPGYGIFKFGRQVIDWVFTPKEGDDPETDAKKKPKRR